MHEDISELVTLSSLLFPTVAGAVALGEIGYIFYMRGREKKGNPVFKPSTRETAVTDMN